MLVRASMPRMRTLRLATVSGDVGLVDDVVDHGGDGVVAQHRAPSAERQAAGETEFARRSGHGLRGDGLLLDLCGWEVSAPDAEATGLVGALGSVMIADCGAP